MAALLPREDDRKALDLPPVIHLGAGGRVIQWRRALPTFGDECRCCIA